MNFFAHAQHCLDDPYQCAGVAVPDWLGVFRPRVRCRSRHVEPHIGSQNPDIAALSVGIMRHHTDDGWFHETAAFSELSVDFAGRIRCATGDVDGMRPSFLGHILVELLLDWTLIEEKPGDLDRYYKSLAKVSPTLVARQVSNMCGQDAGELESLIPRFLEVRFLEDYGEDETLCYRLNQVMKRVRLAELPVTFREVLPQARHDVRERRRDLLAR
ncbi:hypothetical protein [Adhaeretor mobilis]|uniref:Uncharacterized protein n=1 Tax=Adhaeretor mobilis TaxID=1930276 RepID=A0A517MRE4_9BACT|nr:hypothetical protein [Adhaeretor mobilis]QDS97452.1 hypothetical protein HG15A2_07130 [Adhaeretor mobilis]